MSRVCKLSHARRRAWLMILLAALPLATAAASIYLTVDHLQSALPVAGRAATAVILALLALIQLRLLWLIGKQPDVWSSVAELPWRNFARCTLVALVGVFGLALAVGRPAHGEFVLICGIAAVATILLLPIAAPNSAIDFWRRLGRRRWIRKSSLVAYSVVVCVVTGELLLQGVALLPVDRAALGTSPAAHASFASPEQLLSTAMPAADSAVWNRDRSSGLRVALVGDRQAVDLLATDLVTQAVPTELGLSIRQFSSADSPSNRAARHLAEEVTAAQPELVLAVISVADDFGHESQSRWLDWRNLLLPRYMARLSGFSTSTASGETADAAAYLKLAVCAKNPSSETRAQWGQLSDQIKILTKRCREKGVPVALVVVPAKFQLNRPAREALLHQAGYDSDSLDLDLPQRRLAALAQQQQIPLLDLMPELRLTSRSLYERTGDSLNREGRTLAQQAMCDWIDRSVSSDRLLLADLRSAR
jgi:hypothetical protein